MACNDGSFISGNAVRDKLVLKGDTALNLFHFDNVPRLSVDIGLNYIGQINRTAMIQERPMINTAIKQTLRLTPYQVTVDVTYYRGYILLLTPQNSLYRQLMPQNQLHR